MSYIRVIPRDLFNEANLLKCLGKLWINLDNLRGHGFQLSQTGSDKAAFDVRQSPADGSLYAANVVFTGRGETWDLFRPLNSREEWPLWLRGENDDIEVFNENGMFSADMLAFLLNGEA